jgi:hypothetical protein
MILGGVAAIAYLAYTYVSIFRFYTFMDEWGPHKSWGLSKWTAAFIFMVTSLSAWAGGALAKTRLTATPWKFALAGLACFLLGEPIHALLRSTIPNFVIGRNLLAMASFTLVPAIFGWSLTRKGSSPMLPSNTSLERTRGR